MGKRQEEFYWKSTKNWCGSEDNNGNEKVYESAPRAIWLGWI